MQKAVVMSIWHDAGSKTEMREVMVCITIDPPDSDDRALVLSAVNTINPPFSALSIDLEVLQEAMEMLGETLAVPTSPRSQRVDLDGLLDRLASQCGHFENAINHLAGRVAELEKRSESHEDTLSRLAIRVGNTENLILRGDATNA